MSSTATKSRGGGGGDTLEFQVKRRGMTTLKHPAPAYRADIDRAMLDAIFDEIAKTMAKASRQVPKRQQPLPLPDVAELLAQPPRPEPEAAPESQAIEQVIRLVSESLLARTDDEWVEYWHHNNRFNRFNDILDGIFASLAARYPLELIDDDQRQTHDQVVARFPQFNDRIRFAESTMRRAGRIVSEMVHRELTSDARRQQDAECAQLFNWNIGWFRIAVNALCAITREWVQHEVPPSLVNSIALLAREAALTAHHAAQEGRRLRDEDDRERASALPRSPAPDDDDDDDDDFGDDDLVDTEAELRRLETP